MTTRSVLTFLRHYAEMVLAMMLGMLVLGGAIVGLLGLAGVGADDLRDDAPALLLLGMAFTMSVPMAAWMRYRGHGWAPTNEMVAAMFAPTLLAIALLAAGAMTDPDALLMLQHVVMFPAMLVAMLLRPAEYTGHAHHAAA